MHGAINLVGRSHSVDSHSAGRRTDSQQIFASSRSFVAPPFHTLDGVDTPPKSGAHPSLRKLSHQTQDLTRRD
jgi:hypothetical protein